jgi:prepilin-type N-terminal cleavage/methylation domain-containing protein
MQNRSHIIRASYVNAKRRAQVGFTLVEVLVSIILLSVGVVASMKAMESVDRAEARVSSTDLLERLAAEKVKEVGMTSDPTTYSPSGDFTDQGYSDVAYTVQVEQTSISFVDQVVVTASKGSTTQEMTSLIYLSAQAEEEASDSTASTSSTSSSRN